MGAVIASPQLSVISVFIQLRCFRKRDDLQAFSSWNGIFSSDRVLARFTPQLFVASNVTAVWFGLKFTKKALIEFGLFGILKNCFCSFDWVWSKFALFCLVNLQFNMQISKVSFEISLFYDVWHLKVWLFLYFYFSILFLL